VDRALSALMRTQGFHCSTWLLVNRVVCVLVRRILLRTRRWYRATVWRIVVLASSALTSTPCYPWQAWRRVTQPACVAMVMTTTQRTQAQIQQKRLPVTQQVVLPRLIAARANAASTSTQSSRCLTTRCVNRLAFVVEPVELRWVMRR
jgi:hypothetical protein